jgi:glycogen synthase kinase 3 beta
VFALGCADSCPVAELSIAPQLNHQLVPPHMAPVLASRGLDIDNFTPMSKQDMMAKLD